jgi:rod shape-determining protein MreB and related proteins
MVRQSSKKKDHTLHIGIDLGTSRSAVAASNGTREWIESYVGWPKDFVSRKALGKDVVFGTEALNNRLSLDLYRPLQHGVIKEGTARDGEAATTLIRHLIELAQPSSEVSVQLAVGVPAEALKTNRLALKEAVADRVDTLMIVSEPFAVAYGRGLLNDALIIDIGAGTTDVCVMRGSVPTDEDQRTILTAGDYIDQQLLGLLIEKHPHARFTLEAARQYKEEAAFVGQIDEIIEVSVPINGKIVTIDITEEIGRACEKIISPMVDTTMELIARYDAEYQERIRGNIIVAGGGSQIQNLAATLEAAFNEYGPSKVECVDDALFAGVDGTLALAKEMPEEYWEQV